MQYRLLPEAHLQHVEFGSLKNTPLPQQMHFLEWHTRGDFSTAEEHSGKLQHIQKKTPGLSYTYTSILLYRKAKNQQNAAQKWQAPSKVPKIFFKFSFV